MDKVRLNVPFNSISFISGLWKDEHEKLCAMNRRLGSETISPPAGLEPETPLTGRPHHFDLGAFGKIFKHEINTK